MRFFPRLAAKVRDLGAAPGRWRGFALAVLLGALTLLALPPVYALPVLIPIFTALIWMLENTKPHRAAWIGWGYGLGFFTAGIYWIGEAFLVDAARTGWLAPFAVLGLAAGLALFHSIGFAATVVIWRRFDLRPVGRVLIFAVLWTAFEWLRGHILTGFPWNLIGTVWASDYWMDHLPIAQTVAFTGLYGLSLITVIAATMPAVLGPSRRSIIACIVFTVVLPALLGIGGWARLGANIDTQYRIVEGVRLRIVQANIDQRLKWADGLAAQHLQTYLDMSMAPPAPGDPPLTHLIWPEAAVPYAFYNDNQAAEAAGTAVPSGGALLTGAMRFERGVEDPFNSIHAIGPSGEILATYDKVHLVPFGEFLPGGDILPYDKLVPGQGNLTAGLALMTLRVPGLPPFSPLVCYEAAFPGQVVAKGSRPDWLLNVTNDAWFGKSAGPHQHFATARMRTIEEGLPLVRAANTGISAVISPVGEIVGRLGLGETGSLDAFLPMPIAPTIYARFGDWILVILLSAAAGLGFAARRWR